VIHIFEVKGVPVAYIGSWTPVYAPLTPTNGMAVNEPVQVFDWE
jgi:hypothetical protein